MQHDAWYRLNDAVEFTRLSINGNDHDRVSVDRKTLRILWTYAKRYRDASPPGTPVPAAPGEPT